MKTRDLRAVAELVGRPALMALALSLSATIARAGTTSVTATKDTSVPANVTEAQFSMLLPQTIFWTALYNGTPTDGHGFYLYTDPSNLNAIPLTTSGAPSGNKYLPAGTYNISIKYFGMGPGSYTVKYDPTGNGANNGDPHITTVDGVHYDFQSAGEFVALRGDSGMEIQTRQTPVSTGATATDPYTGLSTGVSLNTAVAARVGKRRVTFQLDPDGADKASGLLLRVDGVVTRLGLRGMSLGPGGRVSPSLGSGVRIDFPDGTVLVVTPHWWDSQHKWYLGLDVFHTPARAGIMGVIAPRGWLPALPDGGSLGPRPDALHQRHVDLLQKFADAWRVTDKTSLFDYAPGKSTATYTVAGWPPEASPYAIPGDTPVKPLNLAVARRACAAATGKTLKEDCIFDVHVLGDVGLAKTYRLIQHVRVGTTATAVSALPRPGESREPAGFVASVARLSSSGRGTPTGKVQFSVDGTDIGAPIKLDPTGAARWRAPRLKEGEHQVAARYLPAKDSVFLPSDSVEVAYTAGSRD